MKKLGVCSIIIPKIANNPQRNETVMRLQWEALMKKAPKPKENVRLTTILCNESDPHENVMV